MGVKKIFRLIKTHCVRSFRQWNWEKFISIWRLAIHFNHEGEETSLIDVRHEKQLLESVGGVIRSFSFQRRLFVYDSYEN